MQYIVLNYTENLNEIMFLEISIKLMIKSLWNNGNLISCQIMLIFSILINCFIFVWCFDGYGIYLPVNIFILQLTFMDLFLHFYFILKGV